MKKIYCFVFLINIGLYASSQSQLLGGNAYLQGNYIEVGINECGSFGTTNDAPVGYHARSGASGTYTSPLNLGFVADPDKDGWTTRPGATDNFYNGDYFMPANPWVGWQFSYNGSVYATERVAYNGTCRSYYGNTAPPFPGSNILVTQNAQYSQSTWQGSQGGVQLSKTVTLYKEALYFTIKVKVKNTTAAPINNVYYGDYVNPDNDAYINNILNDSILNTRNKIVYQSATDGKSLVQALGAVSGTYLGLGSKDCRSKVFRGTSNIGSPSVSSLPTWYNTSASVLHSGEDPNNNYNSFIGIAFSLGTLAPGDSSSILYAYVLKEADLDIALASTAPGFDIENRPYNSNDTAYVCANSAIPVSLTNAEDYSWSWAPTTDITPATGIDVAINVGTAPVQYIATGTGPCGIVKDTVDLIPVLPRIYVDNSVAASASGASWASPLKTVSEALDIANRLNCVNEIWVKQGTYYPMQSKTNKAVSRDSSFRINRNGIKLYGGFAGTETNINQRNIAANPTILSGDIGIANDSTDNVYHIMTLAATAGNTIDYNTIIDGFIFKKGNADGPGNFTINGATINQHDGGAIYNHGHGAGNTCSPWLRNNIFTQNYAEYGGALYFGADNNGNCSPRIDSCDMINNTALVFGAGMVSFGSNKISNPQLSYCRFVNNTTLKEDYFSGGAGLYVKQNRLQLNNCEFTANEATCGAGLFTSYSVSHINNTLFSANRIRINASLSDLYHGGLYDAWGNTAPAAFHNHNDTVYYNQTRMTNHNSTTTALVYATNVSGTDSTKIFIDNSIFDNNTMAGAIISFTYGTSAIARNCIFHSNNIDSRAVLRLYVNSSIKASQCVFYGNSNSSGPAVGLALETSYLQISQCTISHNSSPAATTVLNIETGSTATIQNSIVNGTGTLLPVAGVTVQNSLVRNAALPLPNIDDDPQFVNAALPAGADGIWGTADDGLQLTPCSPAVNTGDNSLIPAGITTDINGNARIQNAIVDMGAYESAHSPYNVSISAAPAIICPGNTINFTATPENTGVAAPDYQWLLNGTAIAGAVSATYSSNALAAGDIVSVIMTPNLGCYAKPDTSNSITVVHSSPVTPEVTISASDNNICAGSPVTFTATPVNGGATPTYQWLLNGVATGTNNDTFSSSTLNNNDEVAVVLISSETCVTTASDTSATIVMQVNPLLTPSVSISASQTGICAGSSITFTATAVNTGASPAYQWQINGGNAGTNSNTFTSSTLQNNDVITVMLTSSETCLSSNNVSSNAIPVTVSNNITPTVSVTASQTVICAGSSVSFTATATGEGAAPQYQWLVNGNNAGTNSNTFTSSTLQNNDEVTVVLTSSETCLAANNVSSAPVQMQVNPLLTPSVSITASQQTICQGSNLTFTATPVNGGTSPVYQWKINGNNEGSNSNTFSTSTLQNNDVVTVTITSNEACLAANNITSNGISITVNPNLTPSVNISASKTLLCGGESATFTATPTNGGNSPAYQWKINGNNEGNNSAQFTYAAFNNNDIVTVMLTSSEACLATNNVESNAITINIAPTPVLTLSADNTEILAGGVAQLQSSSTEPIATYNWQPTASLSNAAIANPQAWPDANTTYILNATSAAGCKASASIEIKVVKGPLIANTFSPNGDGINEQWLIKNLETYPNCRIQVFTRTGQLVFESRGYRQPWNGTFKGKSLPVDTYYYVLELNNRIGSKPITGYVTIIK